MENKVLINWWNRQGIMYGQIKLCQIFDKYSPYVQYHFTKTFEFFTIGKCVRSDRNKIQFLRIITIMNLNVRII